MSDNVSAENLDRIIEDRCRSYGLVTFELAIALKAARADTERLLAEGFAAREEIRSLRAYGQQQKAVAGSVERKDREIKELQDRLNSVARDGWLNRSCAIEPWCLHEMGHSGPCQCGTIDCLRHHHAAPQYGDVR